MTVAGVDACPQGWFLVALDEAGNWECDIYTNAGLLWENNRQRSLILIDIPIGLPFEASRACDVEARRILGRRGSSVFPAPSREAIDAKDYRDACSKNFDVLGKKISKQAWNISPKIKQVDDLLQADPLARATMRESHPEIAFWSLNAGSAFVHNKKTAAGSRERLRILTAHLSFAEEIVSQAVQTFRRKVLGLDDILDALSLAVTAMQSRKSLVTLPEQPPRDRLDLPMEIVYSNVALNLAPGLSAAHAGKRDSS